MATTKAPTGREKLVVFSSAQLQRTIQRLVEDTLATEILAKRFSAPSTIYVDFDADEKHLTFNTQPVVKAVKH